jgi:hypothetical protein
MFSDISVISVMVVCNISRKAKIEALRRPSLNSLKLHRWCNVLEQRFEELAIVSAKH